jgi:hypothetical protein
MTRIDYQNQAREFLNKCSATMSITYVGKVKPTWDKYNHNMYTFIIKTRKGQMTGNFYDSRHNTETNTKPTEYDILSCLEKYDVGSMDEFMSEFGYEIHCVEDMTNFINTYNAVVKEYNDVRRCFTEKQIQTMRDIF